MKPGVRFKDVHLLAARAIASGLISRNLMKGNVDEAVAAGAHALFFPHGLGHMMGLDVHDMEDLGQIYVGYDNEVRPVDQFGTAYLRLGRKLEPGFVITNEPGCYFIPALIDKWKAEGINSEFINFDKVNEYRDFGGIRLEDDILVTETGSEIIGERVPINPDDVEAFTFFNLLTFLLVFSKLANSNLEEAWRTFWFGGKWSTSLLSNSSYSASVKFIPLPILTLPSPSRV